MCLRGEVKKKRRKKIKAECFVIIYFPESKFWELKEGEPIICLVSVSTFFFKFESLHSFDSLFFKFNFEHKNLNLKLRIRA